MEKIFENNLWTISWFPGRKRLRIQSKTGRGYATAYLGGPQSQYEMLGLQAYHEPRVIYTNGDILPTYMRAKCVSALSRGDRWR